MKKIIGFLLAHKFKTVVVIVVLGFAGYYGWKAIFPKAAIVNYITSAVEKGTLTTSISGTGQVSALDQIDLTPLSSGQITAVKVKVGDMVKKNQVMVVLDQRSANVSLTKAKAAYTSAETSYNKLVADVSGTTDYSQTAELALEKAKIDGANSIATAQATVDTAQNNLKMAEGGDQSQIVIDAYRDAVLYLQNVSVKLEQILNNVDNILGVDNAYANDNYDTYLSTLDTSKLETAKTDYRNAKDACEQANTQIVRLTVNSDYASIDSVFPVAETAVSKTMVLVNSMSEMLNATAAVGTISSSQLDSMKSSILSDRTSATDEYSSLLAEQQGIEDAKNSYANYKIAYDKAARDLEATKIDVSNQIRNSELTLAQSKEDVTDSKAQLESAKAQLTSTYNDFSNTLIIAPFDGEVASVNAEVGDQASASTAAVTLITKQKVAEITLNEVDAAKVKAGQSATITFDAIDGLNISGEVAQVDTIGTVSQGVVSYNVKIIFDVQDDRIKPGMSCSVVIILNAKNDVLMVPSSAIKTDSNGSYVEVLVNNAPQKKTVAVGSSNDTSTEITSGLTEGEKVITQKITGTSGSSSATTNQTTNRVPGANAMMFGGPRD